jgi:hypothetical protein
MALKRHYPYKELLHWGAQVSLNKEHFGTEFFLTVGRMNFIYIFGLH